MALACKYCIMARGLRGSDIGGLPQTEDELVEHIEREHHIPVSRDGETNTETQERFKRENPQAGGPNCRCPKCVDEREGRVRMGFPTSKVRSR